MGTVSESTRICTVHFEGGEKSNNPLNASYNPTIFPAAYKKSQKFDSARSERLKARELKNSQTSAPIVNEINISHEINNDGLYYKTFQYFEIKYK